MGPSNSCRQRLSNSIHSLPASMIIVGPAGAGKSTLARALGKLTGLPIIEIGAYVKAEARVNAPELAPVDYADRLFAAGRYWHFVEYLAGLELFERPSIIVGPRRQQELAFLREMMIPAISIGLAVPPSIREKRRPDLSASYSPARTWLSYRDEIEFGWGIHATQQRVDLLLDGQAPPHLLAMTVWEEWRRASFSHSKSRLFVNWSGPSGFSLLAAR